MIEVGKVFHAMADGTRRAILELLRAGDRSAGDIASHFECARSGISFHLGVLREAGLVAERRDGQHNIYSLREDSIVETIDGFLARLCPDKHAKRAAQKEKRAESRKNRKE